jgi:thiol-disulfide isomerase/thioredoxin
MCAALAAVLFAFISAAPPRACAQTANPSTRPAPPQQKPMAPDFPEGMQWLNTDRPLTLRELRGKVVLLDFWTYCCINCMHIIPDLKKLEAKYASELVVIGVHSAKFTNEKETENIRQAILRYEIEHPVVNDKDFHIWRAYGAEAWPTLFLIDPDGRVWGWKSGEGVYEPFDRAIGQIVREFGAKGKINRKPLTFKLEKSVGPKSVLAYPGKVVGDAASNRLFFTDSNHNRVVITSLKGEVQEVIGEGTAGHRDGGFDTARFNRPQGLCFDAKANAIYVADTEGHRIRKVDLAAKTVTTLAGTGKQAEYPPLGGSGTAVAISTPWDLTQVGNTLYIAMAGTHQLWTLDLTSLRAEPYAGTAGENIVDGPLKKALLAQPSGITVGGNRLYFADSEVSGVRWADIGESGSVGTLIGTGLFDYGDVDGKYPEARLQHPLGVAWHDGFVYVADSYNHKIKRVDPKNRTVETVIGTGKPGMADGAAKAATLHEPSGLTWVDGKLYITDTNNHLLRVYDPAAGSVSTLKLSNVGKLAQKALPQFSAREKLYPAVTLAPDARSLTVQIELPKGTKFNPAAPFSIKAASNKPEVVTVGDLASAKPAKSISVPLTLKPGESTVTVDLLINYCNEGNEGLCYFKEIRLVVPVKVEAGGAPSAQVTYAP